MKSSRALTTFAYVADEFARTNDIAAGLMPLFAPLISMRAGTPFAPVQFAQDVKTTYDLELHPLVAEEFAPSLAARGYLLADRRPGAVHYTNLDCQLPDQPIREDKLQQLVDGFCSFSEGRLRKTRSPISSEQLQTAFFDRLVHPDFLGLLLQPDQPHPDPKILTLKQSEQNPGADEPKLDQQLDYLVASYVLHVYQDAPELFESIVAAASGALVSEVVLNLQHPLGDVQPMSGIDIAVDSPLVLEAMDLGHIGATEYAKALIEQIKNAGAHPFVFADTVEEIRGALLSPLQNYERQLETYGPLGRRLHTKSTVAPYVRSILPRLSEEIRGLGIDVVEISVGDRARNRTIFTETHENQMANELGWYERDTARLHDARVIADVLRLRGGEHVTSIGDAKTVFVTRNSRLVRRARQYLTKRSIMSREYFPPCISDRHLAGLVWISVGGGGDTLSRLRLVANCTAAVMPRRDLVSRMHRFFRDLNPAMEERFHALMTNERAEHFLMDRTLSDPAVITETNYEQIYREIEDAAAERVTKRKDIEIASLKTTHLQEIERHKAELARIDDDARTAQQDARQLAQNAKDLAQNAEGLAEENEQLADEKEQLAGENEQLAEEKKQLANEKVGLAEQLYQRERGWAMACLNRGQRVVSAMHGALTVIIGLVAAIPVVLGDDSLTQQLTDGGLTFLATVGAAIFGNRIWANNPLERLITRRRDAAVRRFARKSGIEDVLTKFELDWDNRTVNLTE